MLTWLSLKYMLVKSGTTELCSFDKGLAFFQSYPPNSTAPIVLLSQVYYLMGVSATKP